MHRTLYLMCVLMILCSQGIGACKKKMLRPGQTYLLSISGARQYMCIDVETIPGHRLVMDCTGKDRYFETNPRCHDDNNKFYFGNDDGWIWSGCGTRSDLVLRSTGDYFIADFVSRKKYHNIKYRGIKCDIKVEKDIPIPTMKPTTTTSAKPTVSLAPNNTTTVVPVTGCECGIRNNNGLARVINGKETLRNEYPFFAGLVEKKNKRDIVCGGSLISKRWVLSATHCHFPGETFLVVLGGHHVNNLVSSNYFDVERMVKHEGYNKNTNEHDVMLLKLAKSVDYSSTISPVCLPSKSFTDASYNQMGIAMGYGATAPGKNGQLAEAIRHVQLQVQSTEKCRTYPFEAYQRYVTDDMICTYTAGKSICVADSGGPLVFEKNGRLTQVGVISWGMTCAGKNMPAVYMKVEHYIDWIKKNTNDEFCYN